MRLRCLLYDASENLNMICSVAIARFHFKIIVSKGVSFLLILYLIKANFVNSDISCVWV